MEHSIAPIVESRRRGGDEEYENEEKERGALHFASVDGAQNQTGIRAAESEGIRHGVPHGAFLGLQGDEINVATV